MAVTAASASLRYIGTTSLPAIVMAAADIPVAYLSQTINAESGMSFFEYINHARIEAARAMLESEPGLSLANLYVEVGFNAKSSFYTRFKKYGGGATPRQYLAALNDSQPG